MNSSAFRRRRLRILGTIFLAALLPTAALWFPRTSNADQISAILENEGIPGGVIAVSLQGKVVTREVIGRSSSSGLPLAADARFPLASLSKPITASTIRSLARAGALSLDDPLRYHVPSLDLHTRGFGDAITIGHLLEHRSGLDESNGDPLFLGGSPVGCQAAIGRPLRISTTPGQEARYSNLGYCLLGVVVQEVTGLPYEEASRRALALPPTFTVGPPPHPAVREGRTLSDEVWVSLGPAGGWFTDAESFAHFAARDAMDTSIFFPHDRIRSDFYYGRGWRVWPGADRTLLTHFGDLPGAFTVVVAKPDGRAVVLLTNGRPRDAEKTFRQLLGPLTKYLN